MARPITRKADDKEPFSALAFKIMADPFVGQLTFIRVYSGQLKIGRFGAESAHWQDRAHWALAEDARQQARRHQRNSCGRHLRGGGIEERRTGDTICDEDHPIALESITFAVPVISVAVEPKTKADQEKMGMALAAGAGRSHL